jgi:methionyl aminopeptidase
MIAKTELEISILRESGKRLGTILKTLAETVKPGISTGFLDECAERLIKEAGGDAVFKGYKAHGSKVAYPASVCVSVNNEIVHGIPRADRILQEGDIVGLDIGMRYPSHTGLITDTAVSVPVGHIRPDVEKLLKYTEESLYKGIEAARVGKRMGDIGHAIQTHLETCAFGIVRELVGHGVGKKLHEDPYVPNYGNKNEGELLKEGMVLALEPMATIGSPRIVLDNDGWTYKTKDGSFAAHFEHTIIIRKQGTEIVTKI